MFRVEISLHVLSCVIINDLRLSTMSGHFPFQQQGDQYPGNQVSLCNVTLSTFFKIVYKTDLSAYR